MNHPQRRISKTEAERGLAPLFDRRNQLKRACNAKSEQGSELLFYLRVMKAALTEARNTMDPEDSRLNIEAFAEVAMLKRVIMDWEDPEPKLVEVNEQIRKLKKVLDNN